MKPLHPIRARRTAYCVLALTFAVGSAPAQAQLHLPSVNLPLPQGIGGLGGDLLGNPASRLGPLRTLPIADQVRRDLIKQLLRQRADVLEPDLRGEPAVRREILAWNPGPGGLAAAAAAGLAVLRERRLDALDETMVVFGVPDTASTAAALEQLRALDPGGSYDFNHIYTGSGAPGGQAPARVPSSPHSSPAPANQQGSQIGLVDSGVDAAHEVFRGASIKRWGCGDTPHPDGHGTAVAALMVGKSAHFSGAAPRAGLYAADVYCGSGTGGSADKIAAALAWLARENVGVVNLSIVGPPNQTLERVVGSMVRRGHLLVAAVGNDGPAAPPLYPASYPGVVGVSAVDKRGRVIPEAGRGRQVMFAAPGNNMLSAALGEPPYRQVRGTSFASPIVAALLAASLAHPDKERAATALATLSKQATRADRSAISNETGFGVVGQHLRVDPSRLE
ncbi:MAG: S8 family serine peptidase [Bdellovibrionales bacterium]|nr:S8 family serine peptidase [Massilia sp.]